jgi:hypothetical protein
LLDESGCLCEETRSNMGTCKAVSPSACSKVRRACMNGKKAARHVPDRYRKLNGGPSSWMNCNTQILSTVLQNILRFSDTTKWHDRETVQSTKPWHGAKSTKWNANTKCYWNSLSFVSINFYAACFWCNLWHTTVLPGI